ncbi:aminotransferase class I/II-fold pyridoxal phosphate-dependent enzyme [Streptomyces sp. NPDC014801]|uniref:aminotransferase class I/II-fold pyridoxal phosphate-dependent enzyme n=1 Tax=Streptomyces sp. NPDC014801 TaxID=3364916 RepID=UPI0036FE1E42
MLPSRRLPAAYLATVLILTVVYLLVPPARTVLWALIGLGGALAVLAGVRLNRPAVRWPWYALAAGLLCFAAGDTYYNAVEQYFHESNPFPSPADACYLAVYPLFAAGLFGLVRHRWVGRDLPSLLDSMIITAGVALPVWVYLVQPLAGQEDLTWQQRVISVAYPLGDLMVLAMLARLLAPSRVGAPNRSVQLLVVGTFTLLCFDIAYGFLQLNGTWQTGTLLDSGWVVFYTAWGLAGLHPDMAELTAAEPRPQSLLLRWHRLVLLTAATLIAPALLLVEERMGRVHDATALACFSTLMFLLVIFRLTVMVVAHRKAMAREQTLRTATVALAAAMTPQEITTVCVRAVGNLFGPDVPHRSLLLTARQARELYDSLGRPPARAGAGEPAHRSFSAPVDRLGTRFATRLSGLPRALVCAMAPPDTSADTEPAGALVAAAPERRLSEVRGALEILASHAGLAVERVALRQEIVRRESEAYFRTLVRNASDVILIVDDDTTVRYASPSARAVFGRADLTGTALRELVAPGDRDRVDRTLGVLGRHGRQEAHDHWWVLRGDTRVEVEVRCSDLRQDTTVGGLVVTLRDVTEQRQLEQELTQRAFHDPLTGLPNRTLLLERTARALLRGRRESTLTCVLFLDLDDFKTVNDTLGHSAGDRLLKAVGERLAHTLRRSDTAARLGGDEFAVLMEDARQPLDAELLAAQLIQAFSRPFHLADETVTVSASVGVATALDSGDAEELLALADMALYAAKAAGKRQWRRFMPQLRVRVAQRHDLLAHLDDAIAQERFALCYQPVVDLGEPTPQVVGFEALARWPHAPSGLVPPEQFIPLAEETGQITPLGSWILRSAVADIARLQRRWQPPDPPYVSVNVSGRQWRDPGFLGAVCQALDRAALEPRSLQLELTESVLMQRDEQIDTAIGRVRDLGVRIAVDDFGTGFSSLRYLREFPLDVLKIDKTFIDDVPGDPRQVALVEGIVRIADTLGLTVIAEGIEHAAQRELLADMGCRFGQGYLFARPMPLDETEAVLSRTAPLVGAPRTGTAGAAGRVTTGEPAAARTGGIDGVRGLHGVDGVDGVQRALAPLPPAPGTARGGGPAEAGAPPRARRAPTPPLPASAPPDGGHAAEDGGRATDGRSSTGGGSAPRTGHATDGGNAGHTGSATDSGNPPRLGGATGNGNAPRSGGAAGRTATPRPATPHRAGAHDGRSATHRTSPPRRRAAPESAEPLVPPEPPVWGPPAMAEPYAPLAPVRRDPRWRDLDRLRRTSPMTDAVLDEVRGRHIRCGDHWLIDFASCNYLGFDQDPEIMEAIGPAVRHWGTHPSWSRLLGNPRLYPDIEERLTALLGAEDTLLLPTATLIHHAVIPVLAEQGDVFVEATAHRTVYEGCLVARGQGATLHRFHADRPDELDALLRDAPSHTPRLVCLDGVNSMSGNVPDLPELAAICRRRGATLYVDDAHGFGVIGERSPAEPCPYGSRGNSVVRHTGTSYDGIVLVGGFSKAYSSLLAFLALPTALKNQLKIAAGPYLYSGPSPTASLATALAGLEVNDRRGDAIRADLYRKSARVLELVRALRLDTPCEGELPLVEIPLADAGTLEDTAAFLWERGIYVTLAAYPLVPRRQVGFRAQITALNSDEDIDRLGEALTALDARGALRHRA